MRHDGKTTPIAVSAPQRGHVRPAEANGADVDQAITPSVQLRKQVTRREPTRRGYGYQGVRWQKSVRRIARPPRSPSRKARRRDGAGRGGLRTSADARGGGSEARTVRVSRSQFQSRNRAWPGAGVTPGSARHDGRHPDCGSVVPKGTAGLQSRSRRSSRRGERRKAGASR